MAATLTVISSRQAVSLAAAVLIASIVSTDVAQRLMSHAVYRAFPVVYAWTPSTISSLGADGIVAGTMRRRWNCEYRYPPLAQDVRTGERLMTMSLAKNPTQTLAPSAHVYHFGPWVVANGAGRRVQLRMHHICDGFDAFSELDIVDFPE
jgi:hypothetical protein